MTGRPSGEDVDAIQSPFAATLLESLPPTKRKLVREVSSGNLACSTFDTLVPRTASSDQVFSDTSFSSKQLFPNAGEHAADLLCKLLEFNPDKRITAVEALRHPYLAQFHNPADEPSCDHIIAIPIDDNTKYTIQEYREKLYAEIVKRKKELRRRLREREAARLLR